MKKSKRLDYWIIFAPVLAQSNSWLSIRIPVDPRCELLDLDLNFLRQWKKLINKESESAFRILAMKLGRISVMGKVMKNLYRISWAEANVADLGYLSWIHLGSQIFYIYLIFKKIFLAPKFCFGIRKNLFQVADSGSGVKKYRIPNPPQHRLNHRGMRNGFRHWLVVYCGFSKSPNLGYKWGDNFVSTHNRQSLRLDSRYIGTHYRMHVLVLDL
jgi:hypothetical protein